MNMGLITLRFSNRNARLDAAEFSLMLDGDQERFYFFNMRTRKYAEYTRKEAQRLLPQIQGNRGHLSGPEQFSWKEWKRASHEIDIGVTCERFVQNAMSTNVKGCTVGHEMWVATSLNEPEGIRNLACALSRSAVPPISGLPS